jgi:hypothetical protein
MEQLKLERKMGWESEALKGEVAEPRAGADETKIAWFGLGLGGLKSYTALDGAVGVGAAKEFVMRL